jgi:hypothetical protein
MTTPYASSPSAASARRLVVRGSDGNTYGCGPDPDAPPSPAPAGPCSSHLVCEVYRRVAADGTVTTTFTGPDGRQHDTILTCRTCGWPIWRQGNTFTVRGAPTPPGRVPFLRRGVHFG